MASVSAPRRPDSAGATYASLREKWRARASEWGTFHAAVDGGAVAREIVADLDALMAASAEPVTLAEAHLMGGYSVDHLARLVQSGAIENVGRKHRPRIRRSDVPCKPGHPLRATPDAGPLDARRRMAAAVLTGDNS